ncbi:hypothetical protein BEH94_04460 [Candidatus Altiarchaeales archaeon WOR_SM1_SCG]|nr:hypothetical protein BEH94_04460 [Candidatus Altiarchaeales archaeon WOR_SM1_SCG]
MNQYIIRELSRIYKKPNMKPNLTAIILAALMCLYITAIPAMAETEIMVHPSVDKEIIAPGDTATVTLSITNTGDETTELKVMAVIPSGMTATTTTGAKDATGNLNVWNGPLSPGRTESITYTVKGNQKGTFRVFSIVKYLDGDDWRELQMISEIKVNGETLKKETDSDGDGWSDEKEKQLGTNPYNRDTDGDGIIDPEDSNPLVPEEQIPMNWIIILGAAAALILVLILGILIGRI